MASTVLELTDKVINAKARAGTEKATLAALESTLESAKADINKIYRAQAAGSASADDTARVPALEATVDGLAPRISAQRKLALAAEKEADTADADLKSVMATRDAEHAANQKTNPLPEGVKSIIEVGAAGFEKDSKRGFKDHKDFLSSVMHASLRGYTDDARLKAIFVSTAMSGGHGGPSAAAGADEQRVTSNPLGGFLVPSGIAPGILSIRPEDDVISKYTTKVPMNTPTVSYNARVDKDHTTSVSGGFLVTRRPETVAGTPSLMKFEQITLTANEEWGFAYATERLLTDSPESFVAIIQAGFADEYIANAMSERINGSGVGERQGILRAGCLITVAKESGQAAATITKGNVDAMAARCWRYNNAIWLANPTARPALRSMVQVIGTGGVVAPYFTQSPGGGTGQEYLDGRPIFFTEYASAVGSLGDLILGNWSQYLEGTYESEQYAESMHVRFDIGERAFRFYRRNDGQWWWRTAMTPRNGNTLSPTVVLAARA